MEKKKAYGDSEGKLTAKKSSRPHHPTVAIAHPIAKKSTATAESMVYSECDTLLLNL
jgi:hypothetical protein